MSSPPFAATVYLDHPDLPGIDQAELGGETFHHLYQVKRLHRDQPLRVVDGRGHARLAKVSDLRRGGATLHLAEALPSAEPNRHLRLMVGALKPERAAWLVEKATELGVAELHFLASERTQGQYSQTRIDRLQRVAIAALEQCHGARLPILSGVLPWSAVAGSFGTGTHFVLAPAPSTDQAQPTAAPADTVVWVGPEGGFSPRELDELIALGAHPKSWGRRILRVETAALAAATLVLLGGHEP